MQEPSPSNTPDTAEENPWEKTFAEDFADVFMDDPVSMGVDIVEIARMKAILARTPAFARRVFSAEECAYCDSTAAPANHYATRFAAKEAVLKALGTGFSAGIGPRDVEVVLNSRGKPSVRLHGKAKEIAAQAQVVEIPLSLSYTHHDAVACALALTKAPQPEQEQPESPAEQLARQFKEARSLLDELDGTQEERA